MKSTLTNKLGSLIKEVDLRNTNLSVDLLLGVSNEKYFIPSIANIVGTDLSKYKIVKYNQFAFGPVTSRNGDKLSIALLKEKECIVSSSYVVFEITDTEKLNPDFLLLWFKRSEFDRLARFKSHGSVREIFSWEKLCDLDVPCPSIEEQRKIVNEFKIIENRIRLKEEINSNLTKQIDNILLSYINEDAKPLYLINYIEFIKGIEPGSVNYLTQKAKNSIRFYRVQDIGKINTPIYIDKSLSKNKISKNGDILVSFDGTVGKISNIVEGTYSSGLQKLKSKNPLFDNALIFAIFNSNSIQQQLKKANGTTISHASKLIPTLNIKIDEAHLNKISSSISALYNQFYINNLEVQKLNEILGLLISSVGIS